MKKLLTLFTLLLTVCSGAWGASYTWSFANGSGTIAQTTTEFTSTSGSKKLSYIGGKSDEWDGSSGSKYLKMNGATSYSRDVYETRYFTLLAPSSAGTITIEYAATVGNADIATGSNGAITLTTITATANTSCTSSTISGLTAGTTKLYIAFAAKAYIKSVTWTEVDYTNIPVSYYSLYKSTMEDGATLTTSSAGEQSGSGWCTDFANYYKTSSSNGYMTVTFSPTITLNSNGSNRGRIRLYFGHTSAGKGFTLNVNNTDIASYTATVKNHIYVVDYTIPDATTSLSSVKATGSSSSGLCLFAIEVSTYAATPVATHTITLDDNGEYQGNGTATATEGSATLTSITAPKRDGYVVEGYYDDAVYTNKVATAAGALQASTTYTDANSKWTSTSDEVSLYAKWEAVELANTTGSKTWTFNDTNITSGSKTAASSSTEYVYSSISGMTFGNDFDATALSFKGGYPYYSGGGQTMSQGSQWKFHPTVDGRVVVKWYSAGGAEDTRYLSIGGTAAGSTNNTKVNSSAIAVSADADVVIAGYSDEGLTTPAYIDVEEIAFTATPYTLAYDANGATSGDVPAAAKKYAQGDEVTVLGNTGTLAKTGKVFVGWNTQADGLGADYAADAVLTIGTADVTLYAKWMQYATNADFEAWVQANLSSGATTNTAANYSSAVGSHNITYSLGGSTALDHSTNANYQGLKIKNNGDYLLFLVEGGKSVKFTFGYVDTKPKLSIDGGAEADINIPTLKATSDQVVIYDATVADRLFKVRSVTGNAVVIKKIEFVTPYTVTHTLTNVTKTSGAATVYSGTEYTAVYAANSGYSLPSTIGVTIGGDAVTAGTDYTWNKATGTISIPAAKVTGDIVITISGATYVAPTAGVLFSWVPKTGLSDADIDAGTYDLPSSWLTSVTGGTAQMVVPENKNMRIRGSQLAYNSNNAYIHVTLNDQLAEGDVININSSGNTNDIWISTSTTRPSTASDAAAVIVQGTSYAITSNHTLIGKTDIYFWRSSSTTQIGTVTITRKNSITLNNVGGAANGFSTFCSPNNFTVTGATAYKASLADGKLTLTALSGIIPANAGVILAGTKGATATIAYTNNTATANMDGNDLKGTTARTLTATLKGEYAHFLAFQNSTNKFISYNGEYFPANKAYVVTDDNLSREMSMEFGEESQEETDGINSIENGELRSENYDYYNLSGQKVGKDYKGIVIINGKKYLRK